INIPESTLSWIAYRAPEQISAYDLRDPSLAASNPDGYFEAMAIFNQQKISPANGSFDTQTNGRKRNNQARNIVLMLDNSLSMYGEKLYAAVEATDYFLHSLTAQDRFNLILFNQDVSVLSQVPLFATPEN